jgi:hypothetical protein
MRTNSALVISPKILQKLAAKVPPVTPEDIEQCFATRDGRYLIDPREQHATDPPTLWFIGETYWGRKLKVVFVPRDKIFIRTAYAPNEEEQRIYDKYGRDK